jgi:quercetin dioxygenase-like cupin family protein
MKNVLAGSIIAILGFVNSAHAQDALSVAPQVYKKVLENERIRVLQLNMKPGTKVGVHRHPDHLFYMITEGTLVFKPDGKKPYEMTLNAGEALWLPAQSRAAENDTQKDVRAVLIEFKAAAKPPAKATRGKRSKATPRKRK